MAIALGSVTPTPCKARITIIPNAKDANTSRVLYPSVKPLKKACVAYSPCGATDV